MKRVLIVYNPRSSHYREVKEGILKDSKKLKGFLVGKYEVEKTNVDDNALKFAKIVQDGDLVIAAGGDATGAIAANGIMISGKDATLAALPCGNFNDLARTLRTRNLDDVFRAQDRELWPLDILVDGKHFRFATCYVTIGMTAEAVELFDDEKIRKNMQKGAKSSWRSYVQLASWYFKNRHKKQFLPSFSLNGGEMMEGASDYAAVNGRYMAKVMKGGEDYFSREVFRSEIGKLTNFWNLFILMIRSIFVRTPGSETRGDVLKFKDLATVELQAEGEYKVFRDVKKIEIRKAKKCLKVKQI